MLNLIWPIFIIISFIFGIFTGNVDKLNNSIFKSTDEAVSLCITLLGTMCLWNGIMKIFSKTILIKRLSRLLNPIIDFLFPDIKKDIEIKNIVSMNLVANILGLGNAATPLGIKAMKLMQEKNDNKDRLSNSMVILIVLNTISIQIIPTTVITIRSMLKSKNPTSVIFPIWIVTIFVAVMGVLITKIFIKYESK